MIKVWLIFSIINMCQDFSHPEMTNCYDEVRSGKVYYKQSECTNAVIKNASDGVQSFCVESFVKEFKV